MLTLRKSQIAILARSAFVTWMERHLQSCFPAHYQGLGPVKARALILEGIRKAEGYGFKLRSDICQLIDLMICFGRDFDTNPRLKWAAEVLQDPRPMAPEDRMERLYAAALSYLQWLAERSSLRKATDA